ncbi:hypothetical protein Moror_10587 [Moniliophthora roreri MCA 2997]|uniref:F-box domain-containing protein n=1 Tax=Moniliophthora roreri (strain MCA 2997) TaxID=1381753 RepID=V2WY30_MONRO|nr:hypothetical protein Moror_10587 [Moniliophthora roreri MCA 2997]
MPSKLKGDIQESREECWDELLASRCGVKALRNLRITTQQDHMSPQPRRLFDKTFATIRSSYQKILNSTVAKTVYGVYGMGELRVVMTTWTEAMAGTEADLFCIRSVTSSGRAAVSQYLLDAEREMKGYGVEVNRTKAGTLSLENKKKLVDPTRTLEALVAQSNRWYDVSLISFTSVILEHPIIQRLAGHFPLLHRLRITASNEEGDESLSISTLFNECPGLHSLDITPASPCTRQILPFQQVRSLTLRMCFAFIAFDYLSECRNVERLELHAYLSVFADNQEDLDCVFLNITLPDLSSLKISGKDDKDDKPDEPWTKIDERSISDFVQGSACSITSLCLRWLPLTDPQTITLLRLLPELGTLHIEEQVQAHSYRRTNKIVTSAFAKQLAMDLVDTPSTPFLP